MYITYDEYKQLGGEVEETAFPLLEIKARKKLDYWTQNRITETNDDIKLCMYTIINCINDEETGESDVTSFSNDGISVSYADAKTQEQKMNDVYRFCIEILPVELVCLCVN